MNRSLHCERKVQGAFSLFIWKLAEGNCGAVVVEEEVFPGPVSGCAEAAFVKSSCGFGLLKGIQERHLYMWRTGRKKISSFLPFPPGLGIL